MANRNDELYGYYLMAHIYSGGNCGDTAPQQMGRQSYPSADVRGNDAKAAVALGQMHGRAGNEVISIDRLIATIGALVTEYSTKTGDLSAAKAAMKNVADAGKAANEVAKPGSCEVFVISMAVPADLDAKAPQPNAGDLADMKAATQGLGVAGGTGGGGTGGGISEQHPPSTIPVHPAMGDVWEPRLGGPPIALLFFDPTCGSFGAWRTGYGDEDWITTDALRTLYTQKFTLQGGGCSWATAVATWAAVRAKVTYPARVANLVIDALGENAKMPEIKAAVAALALSEKSASPAK